MLTTPTSVQEQDRHARRHTDSRSTYLSQQSTCAMYAIACWPDPHKQDYDMFHDPRFLIVILDTLVFAVAPWLGTALEVCYIITMNTKKKIGSWINAIPLSMLEVASCTTRPYSTNKWSSLLTLLGLYTGNKATFVHPCFVYLILPLNSRSPVEPKVAKAFHPTNRCHAKWWTPDRSLFENVFNNAHLIGHFLIIFSMVDTQLVSV